MKMRRAGCPAGEDKGGEWGKVGVQPVDVRFQPLHLRLHNAQRAFAAAATLRHAQIAAEIEEIVLDARQHCVGFTAGVQPRKADGGVGFVHRAVG